MKNITPFQVKERLDRGEILHFLDVREQWEFDKVKIDGSVLIPLGSIPARHIEIDKGREWIVYCHHGIRSRHACAFLESIGFDNVVNLHGGIDYWAQSVDPGITSY